MHTNSVRIAGLAAMIAGGLCNALAQRPVPDPNVPITTFKVDVVAKTAKAINYRHRSGATKIDFKGTALLPASHGEAKVESKQGYIEIEVEFRNLEPATKYGPEYLTYVMWAITPEGRATNLGEVLLNGTSSKLDVTTELQAFGLVVTAEPYFSVSQPSDLVVMENVVRPDTLGKVEVMDAKYDLLQRGQYSALVGPRMAMDPKAPIELYEARNAVQIARASGAEKYASETFQKAVASLRQAEDYYVRKQKKPTSMISREAVQSAEDSRILAVKRRNEEALAMERQRAAEREASAKAEAESQSQRASMEAERARMEAERARMEAAKRAEAVSERQAAERAKAEAEEASRNAARLKAEADAARLAAERAKGDAEAARAAAVAEQRAAQAETERARLAAANSEKGRLQAEEQQAQLRKQLMDQFNLVLETRESARGLIINMSDVLFDFGKYSLRSEAREKLAKISGIVLAHPGLKLEVEGHTDDIGSEEYNQKLSEDRANAVRDYLVAQGVTSDNVTAKGYGKTQPTVPNTSAANRQKNRRVEMVVSGDIIGTKITRVTTNQQ